MTGECFIHLAILPRATYFRVEFTSHEQPTSRSAFEAKTAPKQSDFFSEAKVSAKKIGGNFKRTENCFGAAVSQKVTKEMKKVLEKPKLRAE